MAMVVSQLVDIASQPRVTLRWEIVRMDALQGGKDRSVKQVVTQENMERTVRKLVGRVLRGHVTAALVSVSVGVRMATQAPSVKQSVMLAGTERTAAGRVDIVCQGTAILCQGRVWEDAPQAGRERSVRRHVMTFPMERTAPLSVGPVEA